jgi:membrane protease YdiL (CAAX protease family)
MTALVATGWALGTTFFFILLANVLALLRPGSAQDVVSGFGCQAVAYLLGLFLILRLHAPDAGIRAFVGMRRAHAAFYPLAVGLGACLVLPTNALYNVIEKRWPIEVEDHFSEMVQNASTPQRAVMALVIILFGPMLEEVFFRGALYKPMLRVHPAPVVMVVTATLFAIAHQRPQMFLPIGLVGLALALMRRASGSLVPGIFLHASFNAVPFYAMVAHRPGMPDFDETLPRWVIGASCLAAAVLLGCVHLVGTRSAEAREAQELDQ